jgi:hypothetical protein
VRFPFAPVGAVSKPYPTSPSLKGAVRTHPLCSYLQPFPFTHSREHHPRPLLRHHADYHSGTSPLMRAREEPSRRGQESRRRFYRCVRSNHGSRHQSTELRPSPLSPGSDKEYFH